MEKDSMQFSPPFIYPRGEVPITIGRDGVIK